MEVIVHLKLSKKNVLRFKHTAILPVHIVSIFGNAIELLAWYGNVHRHSSQSRRQKKFQTLRKARLCSVNHKIDCTFTSAELPSSAIKCPIFKSKQDGRCKDQINTTCLCFHVTASYGSDLQSPASLLLTRWPFQQQGKCH